MKNGLLIALLVLLVVILGTEMIFFLVDDQGAQTAEQPAVITLSPEITLPPAPTDAPVTPVPAQTVDTAPPPPTDAPAATAPPTEVPATPEPSPEPSPTPVPTAVPASDGSFQSNTGTNLNLIVSWRAEDQGNGTTRLYVVGSVSSYSLQVASTQVSITYGSSSTTATGSAISLEDGVSRTESGLFSATLDVPSGTTDTLTVNWAFKGSYSGVSLPNIQASGQISV